MLIVKCQWVLMEKACRCTNRSPPKTRRAMSPARHRNVDSALQFPKSFCAPCARRGLPFCSLHAKAHCLQGASRREVWHVVGRQIQTAFIFDRLLSPSMTRRISNPNSQTNIALPPAQRRRSHSRTGGTGSGVVVPDRENQDSGDVAEDGEEPIRSEDEPFAPPVPGASGFRPQSVLCS